MYDWDPKEDVELQEAIKNYVTAHGLHLPSNVEYDVCIDGVDVCIEGHPILEIGLPPVSNYSIHETEHTDKYLRKVKVA